MGFTLAEGLIFTPKLCTYTFSSPKMNLDFKLFHTSQQYEFLNKPLLASLYVNSRCLHGLLIFPIRLIKSAA